MGTDPFVVNAKLPNSAETSLPEPQLSAAERLRRLEEAKAFLRQHLTAEPIPARVLLQAAKAVGIASCTLHRTKDVLGCRYSGRAGAKAASGSGLRQWDSSP